MHQREAAADDRISCAGQPSLRFISTASTQSSRLVSLRTGHRCPGKNVDKRVRRALRRTKVTDGVQFLRHISCSHPAMKGLLTRVI
jgi:hypothetical protein